MLETIGIDELAVVMGGGGTVASSQNVAGPSQIQLPGVQALQGYQQQSDAVLQTFMQMLAGEKPASPPPSPLVVPTPPSTN